MLLTPTVFNGSCSYFHQYSGLYCVTHPVSFSEIGQLWIFGQNPAAQLDAWILANWDGSQVDWVVSLDHCIGSQVDLVWFKILPHSSKPGFWPTGMGPRSTGLCPWTTGLGPRSTWLGPRTTGLGPRSTGFGSKSCRTARRLDSGQTINLAVTFK